MHCNFQSSFAALKRALLMLLEAPKGCTIEFAKDEL